MESLSPGNTRSRRQLGDIGRPFRRPTRTRKAAFGIGQCGPVERPLLQVAMTIAMPSSGQRGWTHKAGQDEKGSYTHEPFNGDNSTEYSLGLMDIPWHPDGR